eukprot:7249926-Pyramimonas_sp.AAC.1
MAKTAQGPPRRPKGDPSGYTRGRPEAKPIHVLKVFNTCLHARLLERQTAHDGPRRHQDRSKTAHKAPERAPR